MFSAAFFSLGRSNDGKKWTKLLSHKKDESLNAKGAAKTWQIPKPKKSYRMFRILQTGKNSNNHWFVRARTGKNRTLLCCTAAAVLSLTVRWCSFVCSCVWLQVLRAELDRNLREGLLVQEVVQPTRAAVLSPTRPGPHPLPILPFLPPILGVSVST